MGRKSEFCRYGLLACFLLFTGGLLFSADRYALVIGNGNYRDKTIASLSNPVNDAADVAAALRDLDYNVTLKTDIGLRDMINAIREFSVNLGRSSENEGFFWFAGHGLSVRGIHYMLPVDVDPVDDNIIARGSYSVDDLMEEIGNARNKTNLVVIDACRNTLLPGSGNRSVGTRGLSVLSSDDYRTSGNKIVYSTMAGRTAADGLPGSRNSPFAKAFIDNIRNPESFDDVFLDITNETIRLTNGDQQPYSMGSFAIKSYSLNPQVTGPAMQTGSPVMTAEQPRPYPAAQSPVQNNSSGFFMDNRRTMNLSLATIFYTSTFSGEGFGIGLNYTFYEKYGTYGKFFFAPNSFFIGADLFYDTGNMKWTSDIPNFENYYNTGGKEEYVGFIWNLGALWKIRFDRAQRFIGNFGLSLSFFTATGTLYDSAKTEIDDYLVPFDPGFGVYLGISFRITRLVSLDLNFESQVAIPTRSFTYTFNDGLLPPGHLYAKDLFPLTLGGRLGLSFWFPK